MLKKMTGSKVRNEKMENIKGSGGIMLPPVIANQCDCYCESYCGRKVDMDRIQHDSQYEYRE